MDMRIIAYGVLLCTYAAFSVRASAADSGLVHGLWIWKTASVLEPANSTEVLRDFCKSKGINEVYVSISIKDIAAEDARLVDLIQLLHHSHIKVEALLGSTEADKPGKPRDEFLEHVRGIVQFNQKHSKERFDGIHLDIEPHQRPENKGAGNLKFLPDLVETFRAVRAVAESDRMIVNADIENKILKSDASERKALLNSVNRLTLMLYEQSSPDDGKSAAKKAEKLHKAGQKFLDMAYEGVDDPNVAKMAIALRTPDYGDLLPDMLKALDKDFRGNPHYLGWGRHSYNDQLK